jgi:N-acylethanolamine-hydrolysing acid amidase
MRVSAILVAAIALVALTAVGVTATTTTSATAVKTATAPPSFSDAVRAPRHLIDISLPPAQRWKSVALQYKEHIVAAEKFIRNFVPAKYEKLLDYVADAVAESDFVLEPYRSEMKGIADATGIPHGNIIALNLIYDLTAFCTSIVAQDSEGHILHARNLDFDLPAVLRPLTIEVEFKNGVNATDVEYYGVTYAGYVGLATAMRPNQFSISLDERQGHGSLLENIMDLLTKKNAAPVAFHVRSIVADDTVGSASDLFCVTFCCVSFLFIVSLSFFMHLCVTS